MSIYVGAMPEVIPMQVYEGKNICIIKAKERVINRGREKLFINLHSLANALNVPFDSLLEILSYKAEMRGYLHFCRNLEMKATRLFDLEGFESLVRELNYLGYDKELLSSLRGEVKQMIEQIERSE